MFKIISILKELLQLIKFFYNLIKMRLIGKNKKIIYCNSNKRIADYHSVLDKIGGNKLHIVIPFNAEYDKYYKKMEKFHKRLKNAQLINNNIYYCGFASVPFAVKDGYEIGDTIKTIFFEFNSEKCEFEEVISKTKNKCFDIFSSKKRLSRDIALIISCSFMIRKEDIYDRIGDIDIIEIIDKEVNSPNYEVSIDSLEELQLLVKQALLDCKNEGYKVVHIFAACRQSQSFTIGTAIAPHGCKVVVYEYLSNEYTWGLNIHSGLFID